jgi:hypothetical protein
MHYMIRQRNHSTGTDPAMAQPHNDQRSIDVYFLALLQQELIEQSDNSFNCLSSFLAASEAIMEFSAVLPLGGSSIASSS